MAAIDVSALGTALLENAQAVSLVGVACLGIWGAISAFRVLRELLEIGSSASSGRGGGGGGSSSLDRLAEARAHAQQMQLTGEGQSAAYAEHEARGGK
ncbi:major capsid protein [Variovorax sp. CAN2819]|uniref:major capsid protein n=1 Tax=Variovorax sp. CAN15 TaxID=3046727 RepID=UPI0026479671|nr:major capsid protein [Variovorax sp. CAN15]MDN6886488.1 major capsid protein [Variovorax sp. CAN15]